MPVSIADVRQALSLSGFDSFAAQKKMMPSSRSNRRPAGKPGRARQGAVMVLLYTREGATHLVLTRRRDDLNAHAGQISFPGGRREPDEALLAAALRETHEEVGVAPAGVMVLGQLSPLYIPPSDFEVHPFVGWHERSPQFVPQPEEVAQIIETPLADLLEPNTRAQEIWTIRGYQVEVPFFRLDGHKVWGATAMILSEFLERLRTVHDGFRNGQHPARSR